MSSDDDDDVWGGGSPPSSDNDDFDIEFKPEMGAFGVGGRVGAPGQNIIGNIPENRIERAMMEPLERFRMYVDAVARNLNNWDEVNLSEENIEFMLIKAEKIPVINHKNPTAYVLAFIATNGGKNMNKNSFNHVVNKVLPRVTGGSVLPPDIIRYVKLWESL